MIQASSRPRPTLLEMTRNGNETTETATPAVSKQATAQASRQAGKQARWQAGIQASTYEGKKAKMQASKQASRQARQAAMEPQVGGALGAVQPRGGGPLCDGTSRAVDPWSGGHLGTVRTLGRWSPGAGRPVRPIVQ